MFAIKTEVRDLRARTYAFAAQKTMYGGKKIAKGDTIYLFASENEGGPGLRITSYNVCYTKLLRLSLGAMAISAFKQSVPEVTRTKGIIIEDAQGRERILIGAPIPASRARVRTDTSRVRQVWAQRSPNP